jgi:hypothetical protein
MSKRWSLRRWSMVLLPLLGIAAGLLVRQAVRDVAAPAQESAPATSRRYPVVIEPVAASPQLTVTLPGTAAPTVMTCATCHSLRREDEPVRLSADLKRFHLDVKVTHGALTCHACHNPDNADTLRLSDGTPIAFAQTRRLCAQCHADKAESYRQGAHGGMAGYWDLTAGPRTRKHCINCHAPHHPAYPSYRPAPGPNDRVPPHHPQQSGKGGES